MVDHILCLIYRMKIVDVYGNDFKNRNVNVSTVFISNSSCIFIECCSQANIGQIPVRKDVDKIAKMKVSADSPL